MESIIKKITFLGDIMCSIPETAKAKMADDSFNYQPAFSEISNYLKRSDYVVGNLETPIAGYEQNYTSETTLFNTPVDFVRALKDAGVNMVTTANNHAMDRGLLGLQRTIKKLEEVPIEFTGTRAKKDDSSFLIKDFNGFRIAFLSYTYGTDAKWRNNALKKEDTYHLNYFKEQEPFPLLSKTSRSKEILKLVVPEIIKRIGRDSTYPDCGTLKDIQSPCVETMLNEVRKAKHQADYVVMCIHIGGQYNNNVGAYTKAVVQKCVEAGCDTIIGNHPHCVQQSALLPNGFLAYALGNFYCTPHWGYYIDGIWAEYSIVLNLFFDVIGKSLKRVTFSVAKSMEREGHSVVRLVSDIYAEVSEKEKRKLQMENAAVLSRFLGIKYRQIIHIKEEYDYQDFICDQ